MARKRDISMGISIVSALVACCYRELLRHAEVQMKDYIQKREMKMHNLKYVVMVCVMSHNLFIAANNPCNPCWRLSVQEFELTNKINSRSESKSEPNKNI